MIEESLLFRVWYMFPDITMTDMVISFFIVLVLAFFLFRTKSPPQSQPLPITKLPNISEENFEERLSEYIRLTLAHKYSPEHAWSHTAREIESYAKGDKLLSVLRDLERVEYTSKRLTDNERVEFLKQVKKNS